MNKDSSKKIAFILGGLNYGGAERVASRMICYWNEQKRPLAIISRRGPEHDFFKIPVEIERYNLGGEGASSNKLAALLKNIPFVFRLRKAIKKTNANVVVSFLTKTNIHTILACMWLDVRVIISERNDTTRQRYPWPWPLLRNWLYKYADVVTANSEIAITGMEAYVPKQKLQLVKNPVEFPSIVANPDESSIILNVGRIVPQKAQHILIKAFSNLPTNDFQKWSCHIVGGGELLYSLKKLTKTLGCEKNVIFHGMVKNPEVHFKNAGIFVLTSTFEGTPNALLEAMSYGLPVVVSDCLPGALEYVEDGVNGLIFKESDIEDLSLKLIYLIQNPKLRKRMGLRSVSNIKELSVEKIMQQWNQII